MGQAGTQALYPVLASGPAFVDMLGGSRLDTLLSPVSYSCQQFRTLLSMVIKNPRGFWNSSKQQAPGSVAGKGIILHTSNPLFVEI